MHTQTIKKLQKLYGFDKVQNSINAGQIWHFEGSAGRYAMDLLKVGICLLPVVRTTDFYGSTIPSRYDVKPDSPGSLQNAQCFWGRVNEGDIDAMECIGVFQYDNKAFNKYLTQ